MQPTLEPVAKIPLVTTHDGAVYTPALSFAPDGAVLYVRQPVHRIEVWDVLRWRAPDVAAPLLVVVLVWMVWAVRGIASRPRERGRVYCRRCNHELIAPAVVVARGRAQWGEAGARCGECGRGGPRPPVVGRPRRSRLWPVLLGGVVATAALGGALVWSLEPLGTAGRTWPVAGLEGVGWTIQRATSRRELVHRITRWEVPSGRGMGSLGEFRVRGMFNAALSPDGRMFAVVGLDLDRGGAALRLIDAESGVGRDLRLGEMGDETTLVGFSDDSRMVYIQRYIYSPPGFESALEAVEVQTMGSTEVARVPVPQDGRGHFAFLAGGPSDQMRWAAVRIPPAASGAGAEIIWSDGGPAKNLAAPITSTQWWKARLSADLRAVEVVGLKGEVERIDLATGAATAAPTPAAMSLLSERAGAVDVRWLSPGLEAADAGSGRRIAVLSTDGRNPAHGAAVSRDGRYVACQVVWAGPDQAMTASAVYVWDLGPVRE